MSLLDGLPEPPQRPFVSARPSYADIPPLEVISGLKYPSQWSSKGSAERNKDPIRDALTPLFTSPTHPARNVLELASGFGEQVCHVARAHPHTAFTPTECDPHLVAEIKAELEELREKAARDSPGACGKRGLETEEVLQNVREPRVLDVMEDEDWRGAREGLGGPFDGVIVANLLHCAPFEITISIFQHLSPLPHRAQNGTSTSHSPPSPPILDPHHGWIAIYGAFLIDGQFTSEGDKHFDALLRQRDDRFGLRDLNAVVRVAEEHGFVLSDRLALPANNLILFFRVVGP